MTGLLLVLTTGLMVGLVTGRVIGQGIERRAFAQRLSLAARGEYEVRSEIDRLYRAAERAHRAAPISVSRRPGQIMR
jgi:hypothetical protein